MPEARNNVALIGMPMAGKSTLGVLLAKRSARDFLDTDLRIQEAAGASLREIIEKRGAAVFRRMEEDCVLGLECANCVIATGGSVVYSEVAMQHLGRIAVCVYLDVPLRDLGLRLGDLDQRGVVRAAGQDLEALFAERRPLYERFADVRVDCAGLEHEAAVEAVLAALDTR